MEEFKKTPKLVSLRPIENPLLKHISLRDLLSPSKHLIYQENDKYVIRHKESDKSEELSFVVYRNFMLSNLILKAKEMREAQKDFYSFNGSPKHPRKAELLRFSIKCEKEFDEMLVKMNQITQTKLFSDGK